MILPFVRELLADLENSPAFEQARRHLALARGRRRVSGLTSTARALYIPLFARAAQVPTVVIVADNKAADAMHLALRAGCDLTGAIPADRVLRLPAHDVLPFENLSPHPDIQEQRAKTLWKIATGEASIVVAPVESAAMKLFPAPFYAGLAQILRRGEEVDVETLLAHLTSIGYSRNDIVEMPGQFTRRGGILDVYSPEADRPVRFEFFGDEIESIRKFDPETQRSAAPLDEARLLPLTETPVTERLLAAVHTRLSGERIESTDDPELVEEAIAAGGVSIFPGWEFFAGVRGATGTLFDLFPRSALLRRAQSGRSRAPRQPPARIRSPLPPRQPHPARGSENIYDESSYLAGDLRTPVILRTALATGVSLPDARLVLFGAQDFFDEADVTARPAPENPKPPPSSPTSATSPSATTSSTSSTASPATAACASIERTASPLELMILEFADEAQALRPAHAPRPHPEIPLHRHRPRARQLNKLGSQPGRRPRPASKRPWPTWPPSCSSSTRSARPPSARLLARQQHAARVRRRLRLHRDRRPDLRHRRHQGDMESTQPMDRLLCGDVGYGKTEVAMRAAFKAVQDGKQVAVLTPTTVLASSTSSPSKSASPTSPSTSR
jgi:hypothetical protein